MAGSKTTSTKYNGKYDSSEYYDTYGPNFPGPSELDPSAPDPLSQTLMGLMNNPVGIAAGNMAQGAMDATGAAAHGIGQGFNNMGNALQQAFNPYSSAQQALTQAYNTGATPTNAQMQAVYPGQGAVVNLQGPATPAGISGPTVAGGRYKPISDDGSASYDSMTGAPVIDPLQSATPLAGFNVPSDPGLPGGNNGPFSGSGPNSDQYPGTFFDPNVAGMYSPNAVGVPPLPALEQNPYNYNVDTSGGATGYYPDAPLIYVNNPKGSPGWTQGSLPGNPFTDPAAIASQQDQGWPSVGQAAQPALSLNDPATTISPDSTVPDNGEIASAAGGNGSPSWPSVDPSLISSAAQNDTNYLNQNNVQVYGPLAYNPLSSDASIGYPAGYQGNQLGGAAGTPISQLPSSGINYGNTASLPWQNGYNWGSDNSGSSGLWGTNANYGNAPGGGWGTPATDIASSSSGTTPFGGAADSSGGGASSSSDNSGGFGGLFS
jgi:hypothetical protein